MNQMRQLEMYGNGVQQSSADRKRNEASAQRYERSDSGDSAEDLSRDSRTDSRDKEANEGKAYILHKNDPEDEMSNHHEMDADDLIEAMGVSGLSILSKTPFEIFQCVCVGVQAFTIQYSILYCMYGYLKPRESDEPSDIPKPILMAAIYLHFLNTFGDIPFGINIVINFCEFHDTCWEALFTAPIFFIDAIVTPCVVLIIGSLFLCTSETVLDVLLNSCAVAFISNIDNWILMLHSKMKKLGGYHNQKTLHLPYMERPYKALEWIICIIPVLPASFAYSMLVLGVDKMNL